jgi:hypothetical protein
MIETEWWPGETDAETSSQRLNRNFAELLQEVRIAQVGVQVLLAFQLTVAFMPRFAGFTVSQREIYVGALVLGAASAALTIAPAPFHRLVFHRRLKRELVHASSRLALAGFVLLMLSLAATILLVTDVVAGPVIASWTTAGILGWFCTWWYVLPLCYRLGRRRSRLPVRRTGSRNGGGTRGVLPSGPRHRG